MLDARPAVLAQLQPNGLQQRIFLIDGTQLTRLMIRHGVGCRVEEVLHIKKLDEDFFEA